MRVGVLASEMDGKPTGVGRFLRGLLQHAIDCRPHWRFTLLFQGRSFDDPLFAAEAIEPLFLNRPRTHPVLFEQLLLPRLLPSLNAFFSPSYSLPPRLPCPSLVAIHDLSFEILPHEFGGRERWRRRYLARRAARQANRVLTISEQVARQLQDLYRVEPGRLAVLPLAVDRRRFRITCGKSSPAQSPYLLFLGSIFARRRLDVVLEAFAELARESPELRLVLAGENRLQRPTDLDAWIERSGVGDRVEQRGYVAESELLPLLRNAELSYYLSTYEGFGLPPLESLAAGTAVVTSPGLALEGLWPDYPYRCSSIDATEVVRVSRLVLGDEERRQQVLQAAETVLDAASWHRCAEVFVEQVEEAVEQ